MKQAKSPQVQDDRPIQGPLPALSAMVVRSPLGPIHLVASEKGLCFISLTARHFAGLLAEVTRRFGAGVAGRIVEESDARTVSRWQDAVDGWFEGRAGPALDLEWVTPFQRRVMEAAIQVPRGTVVTYGELARRAGRPGAARAVGQVMASNPLPLVVPCHRVVAAGGRLGQYSGGGPDVKRRLLEIEGAAGAHLASCEGQSRRNLPFR